MKTEPGAKNGQRRPSATELVVGVTRPLAVPARWKWHYRRLIALRDQLLEERRGQLADVSERLEPSSMHLADAASDQAEHDRALATLSTEQDALYEIDQALRRIQDGTYGVCDVTGKVIGEGRLRAIPWTRFCESAELELESKCAVTRTQLGALNSVREPATTAEAK